MKILQLFRNSGSSDFGRGLDIKSLCFAACMFGIVLNALAYVWLHSNPLLTQDSWYFLDVFVRKVVAGDLSFVDFFVKRGGADHAQPLNKLILYLDVTIFGMDLSFEALAGVLFAVASLGLILLMVRTASPEQRTAPGVLACLLAVAAILLSLNGSGVYTWSLVTLEYSLHLMALCLIWLGWRSLQTGHWRTLFLSSFFIGLCADDSAFIIFAACSAGLLFVGYRLRRLNAAWRVVATLMLALLAARLLYAGLPQSAKIGGVPATSLGAHLVALRQLLPEAGKWLLVPSAAALVQSDQLRYFFPENWKSWQLALGLAVLAGQLWFWLTIWRSRANGLAFMAICLMLLAYGYLAGIIYGRVSVFGSDYLNQPRYLMFYLLVPVALLLLAIERLSAPQAGRPEKAVIIVVAVALIALQLPLSLATWRNAQYVDHYYQVVAKQLFALARNPSVVPQDCVVELNICNSPEAKRAELLGMMQTHKLSLFSREFDDRHDMHEERTQ